MHYDPRGSLEWGYGTILGDRDINEHGFCPLYMIPTMTAAKTVFCRRLCKAIFRQNAAIPG